MQTVQHLASPAADGSTDMITYNGAYAALPPSATTSSAAKYVLSQSQHAGVLQALASSDIAVPSTSASSEQAASAARREAILVGTHHVPEVAWAGGPEGKTIYVATGEGELLSGTSHLLYRGTFHLGMRHGRGKGELYDGANGLPAGVYEGQWAHGMRHGKGVLSDELTGYRYEGSWVYDRKHGGGIESLPGGGQYTGYWTHGKRHGVGVFTWPGGGKGESREYEHGTLISTRHDLLLPIPTTPSLTRKSSLSAMTTFQDITTAIRQHAAGGEGAVIAPPAGASSQLAVDISAAGSAAPALASAGSTSTAGPALSADGSVDVFPQGSTAPAVHMSMPVAMPVAIVGGPGVQFEVQVPLPVNVGGGGPNSITLRLNADVLRLLKHTTVSDLPAPKHEIVTVERSDTIETALTRMTERNVLSLPVMGAGGRYEALVHLLDICAFLLDLVAKKKATFSPVAGGLRETLAHQKRFSSSPVSEVLAHSWSPCPFKPLPANSPLIYAAQTLAEGVHAVPIVDTEGKLVRILTQADVVRFLASHLDELGPLGGLTIGQLLPEFLMGVAAAKGEGSKAEVGQQAAGEGAGPSRRASWDSGPLVVTGLRDKAYDVLEKMRKAGAPAAAVTDAYGAMVANMSFSDLKMLARKANFSALSLPVQQFLTALERGNDVMNPSIVAKAGTTLSSVLLTLAATKVHQLYFVDEQLRPVAAIRTGDILRLLVKETA